MRVADVMALQRAIGNQAVSRMVVQRDARQADTVQRFTDEELRQLRHQRKRRGATTTHEDDAGEMAIGISEGGTSIMSATGTTGDTFSLVNDLNKENKARAGALNNYQSKVTTDNLAMAGGVNDTVSMFIGIAKVIKGYKDQKTGADKAGQVMEGIHSGLGGAKGISSMVDKGKSISGGSKEAPDGAPKESSELGAGAVSGITDSFGVIKETFFTIKGIVELVRDANELSSEEKFHQSMEIIRHALEGAKAGVSAVKGFIDTFGTGASAALAQTVPGLGIALACADFVVRSVDLITAAVRRADMEKRKRKLKAELGGTKGTSFEEEAKRLVKSPTASAEKKRLAKEYLLSKGLQYINVKRINRAVLKMVVDGLKIAGDAAMLGGASAGVGIGLKVGATGLDTGASLFRRMKQAGRDKASKSAADSTWRTIFNAEKSSEAKTKLYNEQVDTVFDLIQNSATAHYEAARMPEGKTIEKKRKQASLASAREAMESAAGYVYAMGFSIEQMKRETDANELRKKMIDALKKRE